MKLKPCRFQNLVREGRAETLCIFNNPTYTYTPEVRAG